MIDERLQNAQLLLQALRTNNRSDIAKYSQASKIYGATYSSLAATLRFWQIGMVDSYEAALTLYSKEKSLANRLAKERESTVRDSSTLRKMEQDFRAEKAERDNQVLGPYKKMVADMKARCAAVERQIEKLKK